MGCINENIVFLVDHNQKALKNFIDKNVINLQGLHYSFFTISIHEELFHKNPYTKTKRHANYVVNSYWNALISSCCIKCYCYACHRLDTR